MKTLLTIMLSAVTVIASAQKDSIFPITIAPMGEFQNIYWTGDNDYQYVLSYNPKTRKITIEGDTIALFRSFIQLMKKQDSTFKVLYGVIRAGIEFSNRVPDFWHDNNPAWEKYRLQLKKLGYRYGPMKKPRMLPVK